jgi:hypothetical protein
MVARGTFDDVWHVADFAQIRCVVLARTRIPASSYLDMHLSCGVRESKEASRENWNYRSDVSALEVSGAWRHARTDVFLVVDVSDLNPTSVDVGRKRGVANARESVAVELYHSARRKMKLEVYSIEQRDRSTKRVPDGRHSLCLVCRHCRLHCSQDRQSGSEMCE